MLKRLLAAAIAPAAADARAGTLDQIRQTAFAIRNVNTARAHPLKPKHGPGAPCRGGGLIAATPCR
jgi:hypothetical protein